MEEILGSRHFETDQIRKAVAILKSGQFGKWRAVCSAAKSIDRQGLKFEQLQEVELPDFIARLALTAKLEDGSPGKDRRCVRAMLWDGQGWHHTHQERSLNVSYRTKDGDQFRFSTADNFPIWFASEGDAPPLGELPISRIPALDSLFLNHQIVYGSNGRSYRVRLAQFPKIRSKSLFTEGRAGFQPDDRQFDQLWEHVIGQFRSRAEDLVITSVRFKLGMGIFDGGKNIRRRVEAMLENLPCHDTYDTFDLTVETRVPVLSWEEREADRLAGGNRGDHIGDLKFGMGQKTRVTLSHDKNGYQLILGGLPSRFPQELAESELFKFDH